MGLTRCSSHYKQHCSVEMEVVEAPLTESRMAARVAGRRGAARHHVLLIVSLFSFTLLYIASRVDWSSIQACPPGDRGTVDKDIKGFEKASSPTIDTQEDKLLGGLLSSDFDEQSCVSRYQSTLYRNASPFLPSSYLVARLRAYESLHKRCGPDTPLYKKSIAQLQSNRSVGNLECNYMVWTPYNGMGNRMLTIVSAFLYALLTDRVLLIQVTGESVDLFCEPFPGTSWVLPSDFPIKDMSSNHRNSPMTYGNMIKNKVINLSADTSTEWVPSYVYVYLVDDYKHFDGHFFCEDDQLFLNKVNWIVQQSDIYFVPSFFLWTQYRDELQQLFPAKDAVFHHLGRYLFHPTNSIWGLVTRYYDSYLAQAKERIGLQIRTFDWPYISFEEFYKQIILCSMEEELLPVITDEERLPLSKSRNVVRPKAVLVVSLYGRYYEMIKSMYYEYPTANGEVISVDQPTHEEKQRTEQNGHNQKALAEIYLLSLVDVLVTSPFSTFGYVSQGLGGLKPWILLPPWHEKAPDPPCRRALSMEPCFLDPFYFDCRAKKNVDPVSLERYIRHCEDKVQAIKLVD
ncbi:probable fucosyltransferase 8 [Typha angustifolia]|uniref:probable fucosyltransferase 8 n=1 Tax=Typha angustifolia TaxID=59011 RepID=UPI003C2B9B40